MTARATCTVTEANVVIEDWEMLAASILIAWVVFVILTVKNAPLGRQERNVPLMVTASTIVTDQKINVMMVLKTTLAALILIARAI